MFKNVTIVISVLVFVYLVYKFSLLKLLFYSVRDFKNRKQIKKDISGIWLYCGLFGKGKTLSMVRDMYELKKQGFHIYTNFDCAFQDGQIVSWQDILNVPANSVCALDEISYIFNNKEWKNMPKEVFGYVVQQRKRNVRVCGTAQDFDEVDKSIREKAKYIIECNKILGRLFINSYYNILEYKRSPNVRTADFHEYFVRDDSLDSLYNTNQIISMLKDRKCDNTNNIINTNNVINIKKEG